MKTYFCRTRTVLDGNKPFDRVLAEGPSQAAQQYARTTGSDCRIEVCYADESFTFDVKVWQEKRTSVKLVRDP